mmetsp:Transcript_108/g.167  ORF Transcript_108/g.167 Transcript_108/m.167 type:complete len:1061 (-) Transcript_108:259-3441(-)|eukprot:CAMPEP_0195294746 /NCGR_PEP_ID=MMETSP0707-20130614/15798_1 /TAXON_ID=33640 /ORGANISM="Asterionellopsis glacialis, Strain CCMP134" /LENGTH=1060 /DNA_ID=CAMNT_0040355797 /DNA_START=150 /DNA_END=3332 /DNA_ORIENTATION=+
MNVEALHVALQQSFSPDGNLRSAAEEQIRNLKHVDGATTMLLQVAAEKQVQFEVRQAAAIQLKNVCRECWVERVAFTGVPLSESESKKGKILSDADKESIRSNLIEALLSEPEKSIRDLMAETLHHIAIHDFPDKWPYLIPTLLQTISQSSDPSQALRVHNALLALRKICKRYEYKSREQRGPLNEIVVKSFPLLLPLAQRLSDANEHSLEAALMLKQILKIFWSSTQFYLPGGSTDGSTASPGLANPESMQPWFEILRAVLSKPLPEASTGLEPQNQPTTVEERNQWPWWKVKKWAVQIMSRLFSRYGIPSYAEEEVQEFAKHFSQNVATQFLAPVCETLNLRPSGQFCTDRVLHLCLTYVDLAVELAPTYKMLKPHMDFLLYKVCFPTICLTQEDIELFENDPHEFVHLQNSPLADFYDPRLSAITLVTDLVKHRGQDVTQPLLGFMTEILHRYNAAEDSVKNHVEKDGALLCFGSLSQFLLSKKKYSAELEGLLVNSVFPDFNSPVGFLRCRACWMVQRFSTVNWSDDGSNLRNLIQLVLQRLSDPALPVQIEASKALRFLIEAEGAEQTLLPVLPQILTEYFRIMNEIGNDEVVAALQVIIDKFGDHITPHAVALVEQLSNAFSTYCNAGEDDDDDAAMAAAQCLECIATVLKGICGQPSLYKTLEPLLVPLVIKILGNDGEYIEYLECALDILTFLTYFQDEISPGLWQAFPLIYIAYDQWAYDYLNLMVPPLQSFIGKAPNVFLTGFAPMPEGNVSYIDLVFSMVAKTVTNDRSSEGECRQALSLFMSILHNCPNQVDAYLPVINEISLGKLGQQVNADVPLTRIAVYQVLGSALYYNPNLELMELEKRGVTQQVFSKWMKDIDTIDRWLPRKLTVLGLTAILVLPTSSLPASISSFIPQLIASVVKVAEAMKEDTEKTETEAEDDRLEEEQGDGDDDDDEGFGEDEDVTNEVDEAYNKAVNGMSGYGDDMAAFLMGGDWDDEGDDFDESFQSPLDQVDELLYLNDTLKGAFQREPETYNQIQSALPPEIVNSCQKLFAAADAARAQSAQGQAS